MSESRVMTRSTRSSTATAKATTPGKRVTAYLKKGDGVGDAWSKAVLHCVETGEYKSLSKMVKMFPGMLPNSLSEKEKVYYSNDWSRTILGPLKKGEGDEKRARLIEEARAQQQVHLSIEV